MAVYIGLDIGGTKFMAAAADEGGRILCRTRAETPGRLEDDLAMLYSMIEEAAAGAPIAGIGAAVGGPMDWQTGVVSPLHQPEWRDVPLRQIMQERYGCPFYADVDTNIAALGEYALGEYAREALAGQAPARFLYLTISTGMGGGFLLDGKVFRGSGSIHPEIAHQAVPYRCANPAGLRCECGANDCLEALISGNGIRRIYGKPAEDLTPAEWHEVAYNLGQGLRNLAAIYAPDVIRIGGGVAVGGGEAFIEAAVRVMRSRLFIVPAPQVSLSSLGYDTALLGALHVARNGVN